MTSSPSTSSAPRWTICGERWIWIRAGMTRCSTLPRPCCSRAGATRRGRWSNGSCAKLLRTDTPPTSRDSGRCSDGRGRGLDWLDGRERQQGQTDGHHRQDAAENTKGGKGRRVPPPAGPALPAYPVLTVLPDEAESDTAGARSENRRRLLEARSRPGVDRLRGVGVRQVEAVEEQADLGGVAKLHRLLDAQVDHRHVVLPIRIVGRREDVGRRQAAVRAVRHAAEAAGRRTERARARCRSRNRDTTCVVLTELIAVNRAQQDPELRVVLPVGLEAGAREIKIRRAIRCVRVSVREVVAPRKAIAGSDRVVVAHPLVHGRFEGLVRTVIWRVLYHLVCREVP